MQPLWKYIWKFLKKLHRFHIYVLIYDICYRRKEQTYGYQGGKWGGWDGLGDWGWHIYITMHKIDN